MSQRDSNYIVVILFLPAVFSDTYTILLENDPACQRTDYQPHNQKVGVDDIVLHEQLVLFWPDQFFELHTNSTVPTQRSLFGACSGILIRPSGRFVQRVLAGGAVSFWLLRAEATITCSAKYSAQSDFYVNMDQWLEPNAGFGGAGLTGGSGIVHDQDSIHPVIYNAVPDKAVRLDCSSGKKSVTEHISGYVRRLKITWNLREALESNNSTSASTETNTNSYQSQHSSDRFSVFIRVTSRMLFEGNFTSERRRVLCEFFSGFWCDSMAHRRGFANRNLLELDQSACIPASMRCDNLPDCNPRILRPISSFESADELQCDAFTGNYSLNRSDRLANSTLLERWTSRLPWLVLAPVPLVLVCALVRICSQKRHLDLTEVNDLQRFRSEPLAETPESSHSSNQRLSNGRRLLRRKRRGLQHEVYVPGTTLASVEEVDEMEADSRSRTPNNLSDKEDFTHNFIPNGATQSLEELHSHLYEESYKSSHEIQGQPTEFEQQVGILSTNCSSPKRRSSHRGTDKHRRYLCWSAFLETVSSSSNSSSASNGSCVSVCSHCDPAGNQTIGRSQSCGDLIRQSEVATALMEDRIGIEMQPVMSKDRKQNNSMTQQHSAQLEQFEEGIDVGKNFSVQSLSKEKITHEVDGRYHPLRQDDEEESRVSGTLTVVANVSNSMEKSNSTISSTVSSTETCLTSSAEPDTHHGSVTRPMTLEN